MQQIRQHTLDSMKSEMAPWAKDYTPKMEDIQTRLRIVSPDNKKCEGLTDYDELFADSWAKRVLAKGRIGTGKTMLCEKLAFDWARGVFIRFSIVLFISMKLVNPTTPIENVIVRQYNEKGLSITEQTIRFVLEQLGEKALVIVDEFSDDPSQARENCIRFLQTYKNSKFKLLVTMGWFDTWELRRDIQLVCEIQSCNRAEQEIDLSHLPKTDFDKKAVLDIDIDIPKMFCDSDHFNPLLVLFLCFIQDRKTEKLPNNLFEIYLTLGANLYQGNIEQFLSNVKDIGKVAFDSLTERTAIKEDICLRSHIDAGILIQSGSCLMFPHDTIRVFFGALYFILMVDAGQSIESLVGSQCKKPIFLVDSLFLYFCLSLLNDQNQVPLSNRGQVYWDLKVYTQKLIDFVQMDLKDVQAMYPVFDPYCTHETGDDIDFSFLTEVLSMCQNTRVLILRPNLPHDRIWTALQSFVGNLDLVVLAGHDHIQNDISDHHGLLYLGNKSLPSDQMLNVLFQNQTVESVKQFLEMLRVSKRPLVVRFNHCYMCKTMIDLAAFTKDHVQQLHFHHSVFNVDFELFVDADVISCPKLTHLAFNDVHVEDVVLGCLSRSPQDLPNLKYLSLAGSKGTVRGKFGLLFQNPWTKLAHLDVSKCQLDCNDLQVICAATNSALENKLPSLMSLAVSPNDVTEGNQADIFIEPWRKLQALSLLDISSSDSIFVKALEKELFPSLQVYKIIGSQCHVSLSNHLNSLTCNVASMIKTRILSKCLNRQTLFHLDLSYSKLSDGLKYIVRHEMPSLENMILRQCKLTWEDFQLLADADKENRLPKLKHLDVAYNDFCDMRILLKSKWEKLESLDVSWRTVVSKNNLPFLVEASQSGSLGALQKLSLHTESYDQTEQETCRTCRQLRQCRPRDPFNCPQSMVLRPIAECLDKVSFSSLRTVHVYDTNMFADDAAVDRQRIRKHGISVYFTYCKDPCIIKM